MSCSTVDVKAYFLGEMEAREKSQVESHLGACAECRQELDQLGVMRTALMALPEEEVPRRIAFVSDKVFEPRWWQTIWRSGPAMGFASAALLAGAILVHGLTRPAAPAIAAAPITATAPIDSAQIDKRIDQEVARRVNAALAEQKQQTEQLLQASEKRYEQRRQRDLVDFQQVMRYQNQQMSHLMVASNDVAASRSAQ